MPPDDTIPTATGSAPPPKPKPSSISPERFSVYAVRMSNKSITPLHPLPPTSVLSLGEQGSSGKRTKGNEQEAHGRNSEAALLKRAVVLIYSKLVIFSQKCSSAQSKMIWSTSAAESVKHFVMKLDWRSWVKPKKHVFVSQTVLQLHMNSLFLHYYIVLCSLKIILHVSRSNYIYICVFLL